MANTFSFTGFDGNTYELPTFPIINNYNYYIVMKSSNGIRIYCFNENLRIYKMAGETNNTLFISRDDESSCDYYKLINNNTEWSAPSKTGNFLGDFRVNVIIYSSDNLLKHSNKFSDLSDFYIDSTMINSYIATSTLFPIVEEINKNDSFVNLVFDEVFTILPVLLVVFVSFIGIRKAIAWLSSILHNS